MSIDKWMPKDELIRIAEGYPGLNFLGSNYDPFTNNLLNGLHSSPERKMYYLTFEYKEEREFLLMFADDPTKKLWIVSCEEDDYTQEDVPILSHLFLEIDNWFQRNPATRLLLVTGDYQLLIPRLTLETIKKHSR